MTIDWDNVEYALECLDTFNSYLDWATQYKKIMKLRDQWEGKDESVVCPAADCNDESAVWNIITHLNDYHSWSRDKIADWLESTEVDINII